jgi:hypothetical protein
MSLKGLMSSTARAKSAQQIICPQTLKELAERHPAHSVQMLAKDDRRDRGENPDQND